MPVTLRMTIYVLNDRITFPPPHLAEKEGLLAIGGDLTEKRLLLAYQMGIFPWFSENEPIMWWSPDPRLVLYPEDIIITKSLEKTIRKQVFHITIDTEFEKVITHCAKVRTDNNQETWIVDDMIESYCRMHESGFAHSIEAWKDNELAGGLYGVSLGKCFFGESMFTIVSNASKVAFVHLVHYLSERSFAFIDCQVKTGHLKRFGAKEIPRRRFLVELKKALEAPTLRGRWGVEM